MSEKSERLRQAFLELDRGNPAEFEALFVADGQWLGVPGSGFEGETPI